MKIKATLICSFLFVVSFAKAQTVTSQVLIDKAKLKVQAYIKLNEYNAQTYAALGWAPLSQIDENITTNTLFLKMANTLANAKIDTLMMLQKAFPGPLVAYSQIHVFTIKEGGKAAQKV